MWMAIQEDCGDMKLPFQQAQTEGTTALCCWHGYSCQAAELGNDWPLLLLLTSSVPLEERKQEASFIQGSAAPHCMAVMNQRLVWASTWESKV